MWNTTFLLAGGAQCQSTLLNRARQLPELKQSNNGWAGRQLHLISVWGGTYRDGAGGCGAAREAQRGA